jgi:hypothetical protein
MWKKVVALLLAIPIACLAVAVVKWNALGLDRILSFLPTLVGQIIAGTMCVALLGLANVLWLGEKEGEDEAPKG